MKKAVIICALMFILMMMSLHAEIEIWTASDLNDIRGNLGDQYIQMADIDLSDYSSGMGWEPIGINDQEFTGLYNGNGYIISNLYINRPLEDEAQGLFGEARYASLLDIKLRNVIVTGNDYIGGLVGHAMYSYIKDCSVVGNVTGNNKVAGVIGYNHISTSECNFFSGNIVGFSDVGGVAGWNNSSSIEFSYATGTVNGNGYYVGGLVGRNSGSVIRNCYATVDVSGGNRLGGLVGWNLSGGRISESYSAGIINSSGTQVGGFVGDQIAASVDSCYWDITLSGQTTSAAGEGRTTDEMTYPYAANTYTGWNFYGTWGEDINHTINNGYPYLHPTVSVDDPAHAANNHYMATYPNPFKGSTSIDFTLDKTTKGDLSVYNIRGQKVCTLYSGLFEGKKTSHFTWNGKDSQGKKAASGVYMIILKTDDAQINKKVLLTK